MPLRYALAEVSRRRCEGPDGFQDSGGSIATVPSPRPHTSRPHRAPRAGNGAWVPPLPIGGPCGTQRPNSGVAEWGLRPASPDRRGLRAATPIQSVAPVANGACEAN